MTTTTARLHPNQRHEVRDLVTATEAVDGTPALSEYKTMRLGGGSDVREHVLLDDVGAVVGYSQAAWHGTDEADGHWAIEVIAASGYRDPGTILPFIEQQRVDLGAGKVIVWARTSYVAAASIAARWDEERVLREMRRSLPMEDVCLELPGIRISTFRLGLDEPSWLEVNNAVFAGHPENGNMTRHDLEARMAQPWFDPAGFFLAWSHDELVAGCWTKLHDDGVGEIYIVAVAPGWEGRGLGRAMVAAGLDYLGGERHATEALLFVESSNERAIHLYKRMGFEVTGVITAYGYRPKI